MVPGLFHSCMFPCFIIPTKVLERFSRDRKLSAKARKAFADAARFDKEWREVREARTWLTLAAQKLLPSQLAAAPFGPPAITVFNCNHGTTLPGTLARGFTCLRDMSNPAAAHCLAPQPTKFSQYHDGMDPHESSGIPNFAFYKAAMAIGGKSWKKAGKIWYQALTGFGPSPNMSMKAF